MNPKLKKILAELKKGLTALYGERLVNLILYGSQARGDAKPGSDIDLMVVLKDPIDYRQERQRVWEISYDLSYENDEVVSCILMSQKRFETEESPLLMNVRREGLAL
jgi:predicted nucleotidyltransferase